MDQVKKDMSIQERCTNEFKYDVVGQVAELGYVVIKAKTQLLGITTGLKYEADILRSSSYYKKNKDYVQWYPLIRKHSFGPAKLC